jgi:hypothetical protein
MQLVRISAAAVVALFGTADLANAGSAGRCGGTGGNNTKTLTCPSGQYVAAVAGRAGECRR